MDLNASKDSNIDHIEKKFNEIVDPNRDNPLDILNTFGKDDKIDIQDQKDEQDWSETSVILLPLRLIWTSWLPNKFQTNSYFFIG